MQEIMNLLAVIPYSSIASIALLVAVLLPHVQRSDFKSWCGVITRGEATRLINKETPLLWIYVNVTISVSTWLLARDQFAAERNRAFQQCWRTGKAQRQADYRGRRFSMQCRESANALTKAGFEKGLCVERRRSRLSGENSAFWCAVSDTRRFHGARGMTCLCVDMKLSAKQERSHGHTGCEIPHQKQPARFAIAKALLNSKGVSFQKLRLTATP